VLAQERGFASMPLKTINISIHDLDDPELLKLLELVDSLPLDSEKEKDHTDVSDFIRALRLRPGRKAVPFRVIYQAYRLWSYKPTRKSNLGKELTKQFKKRRTKYEVYYYLGNLL